MKSANRLYFLTLPTELSMAMEMMVSDALDGFEVYAMTDNPNVVTKLRSHQIDCLFIPVKPMTQGETDEHSYKNLVIDQEEGAIFKDNLYIDRFQSWYAPHVNLQCVLANMSIDRLFIQTDLYSSSPLFVASMFKEIPLEAIIHSTTISQEGVYLIKSLNATRFHVNSNEQERLIRLVRGDNVQIRIHDLQEESRPEIDPDWLQSYRKARGIGGRVAIAFDVRYEWEFRKYVESNLPVVAFSVDENSRKLQHHYQYPNVVWENFREATLSSDVIVLLNYNHQVITQTPKHIDIKILLNAYLNEPHLLGASSEEVDFI